MKRSEISIVARLFINAKQNAVEVGAQFDVFEKRTSSSDEAYRAFTDNDKLNAYRYIKVSGYLSPEMTQDEDCIAYQGFDVRTSANSLKLEQAIALGATAKSLRTKLDKSFDEQGTPYSLVELMRQAFLAVKVDEIWFEAKSELEDKGRYFAYDIHQLDELVADATKIVFKQMGWGRQVA